ncbi:unnamed protein product [Blepharisma stoltei]|uniref:Calcineurin-like phosphoesterase domain-containing protein n=1 Tax=Blepharisma stoltei TaxID=1481888 RepID=A0AAU9JUE5_9CILI|nr:unnamed protein product [Blepharisma stoltei]
MIEIRNLLLVLAGVSVFCLIYTNIVLYRKAPDPIESQISVFENPEKSRIIAFGDLHGDYSALRTILKFTAWDPKDILVQTGDTIGKGDDTKKILNFFIEHKGKNIIHIMGNHEHMNLNENYQFVTDADINSFGGEENRKNLFQKDQIYGIYLSSLKICEKIGDVIFVHGGISKAIAEQYGSFEKIQNGLIEDPANNKDLAGNNGPMWYREYAKGPENKICGDLERTLDILGAEFMVMGHTTFKKITSKCNNKAIFIDTGNSRAVRGVRSALEIQQIKGETVSIRAVYDDSTEVIYQSN